MSDSSNLHLAAKPWRRDILRAALIVAGSAALSLSVNALSARPVPLLAGDGPGALPERAPRVGVVELQALLSSGEFVVLLDVRGAEPFASGRPAGALNAPAAEFLQHYPALNLRLKAAAQVVVLCESEECPSADRVAKLLAELGHGNVRVLDGGFKAYSAAGLPLEKGGP